MLHFLDIIKSMAIHVWEILQLILSTYLTGLISIGMGFPIILILVLLMVRRNYNKQMQMERRFFGLAITNPLKQTLISLLYGAIGGLLGSLVLVFIGVDLSSTGILFVWPVAILLMLYSPRYMCFSYAGGIVGLISLLARGILSFAGEIEVSGIIAQFLNINLPGLMAVVGILHLVESILIYISGARGASPMFIKHNNKVIGGFTLQRFWPVPIVALVAVSILAEQIDPGSTVAMPSWWPLISSNIKVPQGYTLMYFTFPLVAALGYGDIAISTMPKVKAKKTALSLALYSVLLIILAVMAAFVPGLTFVPVFFAPLAHEYLIVASNNKEFQNEPLFVAPPQGIKVLSVIKDSAAEKMGIKPGYVITRVDGVFVENELHFKELMADLTTYAKFEVVDNNGHHKHVQTPLFGKRRQMGIIIVPKDPDGAISLNSHSPLERLWKKITKAS